MTAKRIIIVGGVAGGASAATRARRLNESAKIVIFDRGEHVSFANCGLPYHIGGQITDRGKLLLMTPKSFKEVFNIDVHTRHEVTRIDREDKEVEVVDLQSGKSRLERYDKLILSPGASPILPAWDGRDVSNVFTLRDVTDTDRINRYLSAHSPKRAVVIGGGYIGLEMVEALVERGLVTTVVEQQETVLPMLDTEMARQIENSLTANGVDVRTNRTVENLVVTGNRVTGVRLKSDRELATDLVLVSIGVLPNTELAERAGLRIGTSKAIASNDLLLTNDPDIYAVGDAAEVVSAVTGQAGRIPLAGPANRNGRHAGGHAAAGHPFPLVPVAGSSVVGVFGRVAAATGLSIRAARECGIPCDAVFAIRGHHVGYYPGAEQMILKVVFAPDSGRVLGAQAVGGAGVDKRIDVIATVIHFKGTIDDLAELDLCYAPQFGAAKDPIHIAAFIAQNIRDGLVKQILPGETPAEGQLIDVRSPSEFDSGALAGAINIPLPSLRKRMDELDREKPVLVNCGIGQRSYNAARILMQSGFKDVWNLAGGYTLHKDTWSPPPK